MPALKWLTPTCPAFEVRLLLEPCAERLYGPQPVLRVLVQFFLGFLQRFLIQRTHVICVC